MASTPASMSSKTFASSTRTTPTRLAAVNPRRECVEEDASGTVDARGTTAARMTESGGARGCDESIRVSGVVNTTTRRYESSAQ